MGERGNGLIPIGRIGRAHGIRGDVLIVPSGETLSLMEPGSSLILRKEGEAERAFILTRIRRQNNNFIAVLSGLKTRNEAEKLTGSTVLVERRNLAESEESEYYACDLKGLTVKTIEGRDIGKVTGIAAGKGQDLIIVNEGSREIFIPAVKEIVKNIDIEAGIITIDPPEGLLDL